jgi:hypothetical protein
LEPIAQIDINLVIVLDLKPVLKSGAERLVQRKIISEMEHVVNKNSVNQKGITNTLDPHCMSVIARGEAFSFEKIGKHLLKGSRGLFETIYRSSKFENFARRNIHTRRWITKNVKTVETTIGEGLSNVRLEYMPSIACSQGEENTILSTIKNGTKSLVLEKIDTLSLHVSTNAETAFATFERLISVPLVLVNHGGAQGLDTRSTIAYLKAPLLAKTIDFTAFSLSPLRPISQGHSLLVIFGIGRTGL